MVVQKSVLMAENVQQLEFIAVSENDDVLLGASKLISSPNWTGHLWYFSHENEIASGKVTEIEKHVDYPLPHGVAAGIFLDSRRVLVGNDIGLIAIYGIDPPEEESLNNNMTIYNRISRTEHDRSVLSLSTIKGAAKFLSCSMDRSVKLWDTEAFRPIVSYDQAHTSFVSFVGFLTSDDNVFVSASFDGSLILWDRRKPNPAQVIMEEQDYRPTHVEWFEDSEHLLFLGCDYGTIKLIDVRKPKDTIFVEDFGHGQSVNTIRSFVHDSKKYLSVCGNTKNLKIYSYDESLKEIYHDVRHGDYVQDTAWLPKTKTLISCSWDSQVIKHNPFKIIDSQGDAS